MGLLDLFKKKKQEEVQNEVQDIKKRELTPEDERLFEFIKNNYHDAYERIKDEKEEFLNSRDYDYFYNKYIDYLVADLDTKSPSTNISHYSYQGTSNTNSNSINIFQDSYRGINNTNSNLDRLNETVATIEAMREETNKAQADFISFYSAGVDIEWNKMMEEIREDELGKTHGMLRVLGIEKYINLSFSEFKQLPKEELDKLVEIQKTSEEIIKNNPEESTDTLYNYVCNEIAQFEKLYTDQEMAQSEELNNDVNRSR